MYSSSLLDGFAFEFVGDTPLAGSPIPYHSQAREQATANWALIGRLREEGSDLNSMSCF